MKNHSLFSFGNWFKPLFQLDRLLNPYADVITTDINGKNIEVSLTKRATVALSRLSQPLVVEMQLYFSCVVKKRVLFHTTPTDFSSTQVNDNLSIAFRPVQASSCDPEEFVRNFPAKTQFDSPAAIKMRPRSLQIDYKENHWAGEYSV